ncbi:DNA-processing protein DprA [Phenylobacterium aquaticum]|uniref:DNA-processing protein DprA n=1 Tax=Phenylobacterium aquaticum TaxID=1763816 RepID=UPI0026F1ABEA|nr:DNA-processing protein DprA [Phenylobacterium aquaticum]
MTRDLTDAARRDWLRLARTENVGPVTFDQLIGRYGEASIALAALPDLARRGGRVSPLGVPSLSEIEAELERGARLGARLIAACEPDFPASLAALDPPPPVIWAWGDTDLLHRSAVAVVGARVASASGQRFARGLAADLGAAGQVVVSGMARGVDGAAHEGALATGTVAVLGGGPDDVYPSEHRELHARIIAEGCVVSENAPGRTAQAKDFPRRNRIIAGLSRAVVVVEAEVRSGSLITARLALEQGREVLAVPGSPLDPRAKGCNDLIRQGAALCESADDVLRALEGWRGFGEPEGPSFLAATPGDAEIDALREQVFALISPTPVTRDDLIRAVGAPPAHVLAALAELALAGRVEFSPGGAVART